VLQLYRQRSSKKDWEMLWNTHFDCPCAGWAFLAGSARTGIEGGGITECFTNDIPHWMPNGGVLTTREAFEIENNLETDLITTFDYKIDVKTWILDFLKPVSGTWEPIDQLVDISGGGKVPFAVCALLGTAPKKDNSVKFKIGVLQKQPDGSFELVGMSDTIIDISGNKVEKACPTHSRIILGPNKSDDNTIVAKNVSVRLM
jgi:hypothetical protein